MDSTPPRTEGTLAQLGIDPLAEQVYRALLEQPDASRESLTAQLRVGRTQLRRALHTLSEHGLIRHVPDRPNRLGIVPPRAALTGLVHQRRAELELAWAQVAELDERFHATSVVSERERLVEVVTGRNAIVRRTEELADACTSDIRVFDTPPYAGDISGENIDRERAQLARGIAILSLYSQESLERPGHTKRILQLITLGEQARVLPTLPMKLHIYDEQTAVVPLVANRDAADSIAIVHRSGLLDALLALFEALWSTAHPLPAIGAHDGLTADQSRLLTLLASGLKDDAIARQLGLNVRTVRRRIAELLTDLNATSRFQAGIAAAHRSWT